MALTGCPECRHRINEFAESCPNCGYILSLGEADEIKEWETREREREISKEMEDKKHGLVGWLFLIIAFIIFWLVSNWWYG